MLGVVLLVCSLLLLLCFLWSALTILNFSKKKTIITEQLCCVFLVYLPLFPSTPTILLGNIIVSVIFGKKKGNQSFPFSIFDLFWIKDQKQYGYSMIIICLIKSLFFFLHDYFKLIKIYYVAEGFNEIYAIINLLKTKIGLYYECFTVGDH